MNQEVQERLNAEITRTLGEASVSTISLRVQLEAAHGEIRALHEEIAKLKESTNEK